MSSKSNWGLESYPKEKKQNVGAERACMADSLVWLGRKEETGELL